MLACLCFCFFFLMLTSTGMAKQQHFSQAFIFEPAGEMYIQAIKVPFNDDIIIIIIIIAIPTGFPSLLGYD